MAKKAKNKRKSRGAKKNQTMTFFLVAAAVIAIGFGAMKMSGGRGGESEIPPAKTPDGRVVVIEFFDFG